jgi:hypothetical protein
MLTYSYTYVSTFKHFKQIKIYSNTWLVFFANEIGILPISNILVRMYIVFLKIIYNLNPVEVLCISKEWIMLMLKHLFSETCPEQILGALVFKK